MKDFIVFAGPNGSGKSSVRDAIANPVEVIIDPDRIARGINPLDPRSVDAQAGRAAVRLFDESLAAGKSISMETTLTGHSAVQRMQRAKQAGYDVSLIYVALHDPELNVLRVAARARRGGHAIDPDTIRKRVETSLANLPRALAIADQAIVLDNSGQTHRRVLETAAQRMTYLSEQVPEWLTQRMPEIQAAFQEESLRRTAGASPAQPKPGALATIFDALRRPESTTPAPWAVAPIAMADRIKAFEEIEAPKRAKPTVSGPEPEPSPRPPSGPKP